MKLHLGCGQKYLDGYVNIDYPPAEHTVQDTSVADEYHDISKLRYNRSTVDEVRLHHVFEHFERFRACAYLASWNSWLKTGGKLHIEVPDFETTIKKNFSLLNRKKYEGVGLRHIFGSQEAPWAVHYEGYSGDRLQNMLALFGFRTIEIKKTSYKRTFNVEIIGIKKSELNREASLAATKSYLSAYLVDDSVTEQRMLEVWCRNFEQQLDRTFAE
jgi:hypothetical protein